MSQQYANQQPSGFKNRIENIAIVGAGGRVGKHITKALIDSGKHNITALARADSKTEFPSGIKTLTVDYDDESSIVSSLQGIDCLIITLAATVAPDTQSKLIRAAATAKVPWVLPNEFGVSNANQQLSNDILLGPKWAQAQKEIEDLDVSSWIGNCCSFWYEYSLAAGLNCFGFDLKEKKVIFFDQGTEKINTTTLPQCGLAIANLLGLKVLPEDENDTSPTVSKWRNGHVRVSSFLVSQKDIFASVLRVTGTKEEDWDVKYEASKDRWVAGQEELKKGDFQGFAKLLYSRVFYPTGEGNYEAKGLLDNEALGLPKEDMDDFTKIAVKETH